MGASANYIPKDTLRQLSRRSNLMGAWLTFHVWAVVLGSIALFIIFPNPLTFIFAFLMVGSRQHGMAILAHDAAHAVLFENRVINDWVGRYLLAAPYGGDMDSYRKYHLKHHRFTQSDADPDLPLSSKFPVSKASIRRKFIRDITGQTFLRLRLASLKSKKGEHMDIEGSDAFQKTSPWPNLIANGVLFFGFTVIGYWWVYFALWLLPLMTWFFAVLRLRNIAEHALTTRDDNPLTHARTTKTNWLTRILFAPYWVNYHVEHHAYMYVPCWQLPRLHKAMINEGLGPEMEMKPGFRAVLQQATLTTA